MKVTTLTVKSEIIANICLWSSICFVLFAVLWFIAYDPQGDMGRGLARIFGAIYMLLFAGLLLVISSMSRIYLVLKNDIFKTRKQYLLLFSTSIPSAIFILWVIGYFLIMLYETQLM